MRRAFFTSGGSDSVETALRLTRQFWKLAGQPGKVNSFPSKRAITERISVVPQSMAMTVSARVMNHCCQAVYSYLSHRFTTTRSGLMTLMS
ncbi:MAG: hypothetical protein Ct9H300mP14_07050 [Gammaproteobacteria bacterium]|nr:MAG: hypothetical protein Ct9H300mP14_07050 [Gammaproteobacteria bacterium]